ncbi:MAG: hypothetical protein M0R68_14015, partial [Bacteroidetes bacterium]|nr:hypothetical protein [Bacteroidota bacterium]
MEYINYRQLADREVVSKLYTDYNTHFEKLAKYYSGNFKEKEAWKDKIHHLQFKKYDRNTLLRV